MEGPTKGDFQSQLFVRDYADKWERTRNMVKKAVQRMPVGENKIDGRVFVVAYKQEERQEEP